MSTTILYLIRHAKAADREQWTGSDRDRPLVPRGRAQADRLAHALAGKDPVLVATSPWLRCAQTAEPIASLAGLELETDERLGYNGPDLAGWVRSAVRRHPGRTLVAVSHGDLIPLWLLQAGLLRAPPTFRTGSLFRVDVPEGATATVTYVDRSELADAQR